MWLDVVDIYQHFGPDSTRVSKIPGYDAAYTAAIFMLILITLNDYSPYYYCDLSRFCCKLAD